MKTPAITPVYLPDHRGVEIQPYGYGNLKIGESVFTYSRLPGDPERKGQGRFGLKVRPNLLGTCPGSSDWCEKECYAKRITGVIRDIYKANSLSAKVPPIPGLCKLLRIHVSGDFDSQEYIVSWIQRLTERPDVSAWGYTRSWRVTELLPDLEVLRALPNMQLFASMDESQEGLPPHGWRRAWIDNDDRALAPGHVSLVCPEETGRMPDCVTCGYCFRGQKHDVTFLKH